MKKLCISLLVAALVMGASPALAEDAAAPQSDPAATNVSTPYPAVDGVLPAEPQPPAGGVKDYENFKKYADAVNEYIRAAQKYIDGATNDANDIINKRNEAVQKAQYVVDVYNASIPKEDKK